MARIRTIKPEFWDSPDTARASLAARLLYIAMWNWADDWGVGSANMKSLAAFAFPNDAEITASELPTLAKEVADCFGVTFYKVGGRPFYAIPSWEAHQRTERKAKRLNPPPPEDVSPGQAPVTEVPTPNLGTTDDSEGNPHEGPGEQGNRGTGENPSCSSADADEATEVDDRFEEFWAVYDKPTGKAKARQKWQRALRKPDGGADDIIAAAETYIASQRARGKHREYTKDPATWLNGEHWNDAAEMTPANGRPAANSWMHTSLPEDQW
ncbi:MAG: hypothetical protein ACRDQA_27715 [Nocardioidaceae bacterium]